MGFVLKQPSEYLVYLSTAVPALMPVNSPALFTVAIPLFEEFQTPVSYTHLTSSFVFTVPLTDTFCMVTLK